MLISITIILLFNFEKNISCVFPFFGTSQLVFPQCYKITQSTGMATQMQRKKIAWPPGLLERERKKKQQSRIFFDVIFDV